MSDIYEELQIIMGTVEEVVFRNEDTGFTVIELDYNGQLLTVVGEMTESAPGEILKATGVYTSHPTFGPQFKASLIEKQMPATASAILKYLSSGAIKGIGPATARKLVETFGDETLLIMEKSPEMLSKIKGFSKSKIEKISLELNRIFGIRAIMTFLSSYGISPAQSVQIWKKWGMSAADIITDNPFILCSYEIGMVFESADNIRKSLNLPETSNVRICGAISYILNKNILSGHTCLPYTPLCQTASKLLNSF
ncbi:MAG: ATP-dependent RecD-like DNA helicase [Clostridia bacterium]